MLYYDRIDVSEGIDVTKTSKTRECDNYHCWYNYIFKFQPYVYNRCHNLLMMSINLSRINILNNNDTDYCYIISKISKNQGINLVQNIDLTE